MKRTETIGYVVTFSLIAMLALTLIAHFAGCEIVSSQTASEITASVAYADANAKTTLPHVVVGEIQNIESVYDGDTITNVHFKLCDPCELLLHAPDHIPLVSKGQAIYWVKSVRLWDIDTPEMHPKRADHATEERRQREKALAIKARDHVRNLLSEAVDIEFTLMGIGKYGRVLAKVEVLTDEHQRIDVAESLIEVGLGIRYDGGTKTKGYWGIPPPAELR